MLSSDTNGEATPTSAIAQSVSQTNLKILTEGLIFVAGEPLALIELARVLEISEEDIAGIVAAIATDYADRGIRLQQHHGHVQFVSAPEAAPAIERFLRVDTGSSRLSNAALETLAVVAYRQPVTRPGIEAVRGVDVSGPLRTLQQRGLVTEVGRLQTAGRPVLYGTTDEFLHQFGLGSLDELPTLPEDPTPPQEPALTHI